MNITETKLDDVATIWEVTPSAEGDDSETGHSFEVPVGTEMITLAVGEVEGRHYLVPEQAEAVATLRDLRNDAPPAEHREMATKTQDGRLVGQIVVKPTPGIWRFTVKPRGQKNFSVVIGVFKKPVAALQKFWGNYKCKACTTAVKAAIMALLAKLTGGFVGAFDLGDLVQKVTDGVMAAIEAVAKLLGTTANVLLDWLQRIVEFLDLETPLDKLAKMICRKIGLCPAGGAA